MARFGRIAPARPDTVPNALFDVAEADRAAQRTGLNALLLDRGERQAEDARASRDLAQSLAPRLARQEPAALAELALADPDRAASLHRLFSGMDHAARQRAAESLDATGRTAAALLALPGAQRPAAYAAARRRLLHNGLAASLPEEYPGDQALDLFARQGVAAGQQLRSLMAPPVGGVSGGTAAAAGMPQAAAAVPPGPSTPGPSMPGPGFAERVVASESGGDPGARNPRSSAAGAGQFLDGTWLDLLPRVRPDLAQGQRREDLLALRGDPALSRQMVEAYAAQNAGALRRAGIVPDDAALMLAHRFGPGGAASVLRAHPAASAAAVLGPDVTAANPDLRGVSVGDLVDQARRRRRTAAPPGAATAPADVAPRPSLDEILGSG